MEHNRRCWTLGAVLLVVIMGSSALTRGAWAQSHYENLHTFKVGANGYFPESALVMDQAGNLYGTTADGGGSLNCGNQGCGTVFELTPGANGKWTEELLHSFNSNDGEWPQASLIFDQAGNLYGTTYAGGAHGAGTVFQLTPKSDGTWTESVLYAFCSSIIRAQCADGSSPLDSVTFDQAGNLYGTTAAGGSNSCSGLGCGMVFKLTPNSDGTWTENLLYSFCSQEGCRDGRDPESAGVTFDQAGNLYGTTRLGGNLQCEFGCGVAFRLSPNADGSWTENVLHVFCSSSACRDGADPNARLIIDRSGNLYGTTDTGGNVQCGCGVAFRLTSNADGSWKEEVLHTFNLGGRRDGKYPVAFLTFDQAGNLYGTTAAGGSNSCSGLGCGMVFKLTPNSDGGWHETILHVFQDHPGAKPEGGVIFDALGNLYGTTIGDGQTTFGSVFEITP